MFSWIWKLVVAFLVWLSADTSKIATEPARCAAAVACARAVVAPGSDTRKEAVAAARKVGAATPSFDAHVKQCKQCADPNPDGPGICNEGFRLFQEDLRKQADRGGNKTQTCETGTCPPRRR